MRWRTAPPSDERSDLRERAVPVPDFQSLMLPLLTHASDQQEHTLALTREKLAPKLGLTTDDVAQLLPRIESKVLSDLASSPGKIPLLQVAAS